MDNDQEQKDKRAGYRQQVKAALPVVRGSFRRPGRPTLFNPELATLICERIIEAGGIPEACRQGDDLPDEVTVYKWQFSHPEFGSAVARAKEILMERWADDIRRISEDATLDPNDRRVRIETLKWLMSKLARRYQDKVQIAGDPDNPLIVLHKAVAVEQLTNVQIDALQRFTQSMIEAQDADIVEESEDQVGGLAPA